MAFASFPFSQAAVDIMASGQFTMIYAAELDFKDGWVRVHSGTGDLVVNGNVYVGIGTFGSIAPAKESSDSSSPASIELTLSGIDQTVIKDTLDDRCRGRLGRVYVLVIAEDGTQATDILFSGRMDAAKFSFGTECSITVPLIDRMAEWDRHGIERWTDENHQLRFPGDRFFYAVAQMSDWPIYWGAKKDAPSFRYD